MRAPPEQPLGAAEEVRQIEVLEVVDGDDGRQLERRDGDRERVVHEVEPLEAASQRAGAKGGERHRESPLRDRLRPPVLGDEHLGQPLAGPWGRRRQERRVVERPRFGEAACEPAGGRLRAPDLAGNERQEADPDPHGR